MTKKPTYEKLEQMVNKLKEELIKYKTVEKEQLENEILKEEILNNSFDCLFRIDKNQKIIWANKTTAEYIHMRPQDLIGKTCYKIFNDSGKPCNECPCLTASEPGKRKSKFIYCTNNAGSGESYWEHFGLPIKNGSNQIIGATVTARNVTDRLKTEKELRENKEKYSTLVENSLTGIYIDQDGKLVFANKKFADIFKYQKEELIGIPTWKFVHPEDRAMTNQIRAMRLAGQDAPTEYEARGITKDGRTIWIVRRNTRIEYQGKTAILGNIVDITQQKWAEEELKKINQELKDIIHIVSHDLKNPLIAIQGFSSQLASEFNEKLGEKGQNYIKHINFSTRRIEVLVNDLLALSRVGQVSDSFCNVSSLEIVHDVINVIQNRLDNKGIKLSLSQDLPVIYCDRERIYQVFENLLVNAIKFIGEKPDPKIEIGYENKDNYHQFFVRDTGIGIDPKDHQKIFEKFQSLKEVEDTEGTGLGLTIVDKIIINHSGRVWVESKKGSGATFYFTLPKA